MISKALAKELIDQVRWELNAHQMYMGIALYFQRESLNGWARLFHDQSVEEAEHAEKIVGFLIDNEIEFELPAIGRAATRYGSALDAAKAAHEAEVKVSERFRAMASKALGEGDHTSHGFLAWFIAEQVEEERMTQALIDLIASGINLFQAEPLLDKLVEE